MKKVQKYVFSQLKITMGAPFIFSILRYVKRKVNLQKLFSEKVSFVVNTLMSSFIALKHEIVFVLTLLHWPLPCPNSLLQRLKCLSNIFA